MSRNTFNGCSSLELKRRAISEYQYAWQPGKKKWHVFGKLPGVQAEGSSEIDCCSRIARV
jgi:hypothetical protein